MAYELTEKGYGWLNTYQEILENDTRPISPQSLDMMHTLSAIERFKEIAPSKKAAYRDLVKQAKELGFIRRLSGEESKRIRKATHRTIMREHARKKREKFSRTKGKDFLTYL